MNGNPSTTEIIINGAKSTAEHAISLSLLDSLPSLYRLSEILYRFTRVPLYRVNTKRKTEMSSIGRELSLQLHFHSMAVTISTAVLSAATDFSYVWKL
jgi:hypothetical protein